MEEIYLNASYAQIWDGSDAVLSWAAAGRQYRHFLAERSSRDTSDLYYFAWTLSAALMQSFTFEFVHLLAVHLNIEKKYACCFTVPGFSTAFSHFLAQVKIQHLSLRIVYPEAVATSRLPGFMQKWLLNTWSHNIQHWAREIEAKMKESKMSKDFKCCKFKV